MATDVKFDSLFTQALNDHFKEVYAAITAKVGGCEASILPLVADYGKDMPSTLQMHVAIMSDQPIFLLACRCQKVPENLKAMAKAIVVYDCRNAISFYQAMQRIQYLVSGYIDAKRKGKK